MKQAAPPAWSMPTQPEGQAVSSFKVSKRLRLVLEQVPIRSRTDQLVGVQVGFGEKRCNHRSRQPAVWGPASRLWKSPQRTARRLGLSDRERMR